MLIVAAIAAPVLLFAILRVNAAVAFLSLCLGSVLVNLVGSDADSLLSMFSAGRHDDNLVLPFLFLFAPAALTLLMMIRSVKKGLPLLLNVFPSAAFGVVGLLLAIPLCSAGVQGAITTSSEWHKLERLQTMVVILSAVVSLFFLWLNRPKHSGGEDKHKK
jgi:xanthine/uracil permease